jgi:hypothetical protein
MKAHILGTLLFCGFMAHSANAADWIVAPSTYSHDPMTGQRVTQYTPIGPFYSYARRDYLRSGYRHTRSSIQAGESVDHMHIVEEFGRTVRPYGEWRFPYRPYSVPYHLWGPPFAGMGYPVGPYGAMPTPYGGTGRGGRRNVRQPWEDGSYPSNGIQRTAPYHPNYRQHHPPTPPPQPGPSGGPSGGH